MSTAINTVVENARKYFNSGVTFSTEFRILQLQTLRNAIKENENEIMEALHKDLNKSQFEAFATEIGIVLEELKYTIRYLKKWMAPKGVKTPITSFPAKSYTICEPYGTVLIMSPWNYPFQLTIAPLIGSIAGGNCTIVKPSALSPNTSAVISKIIKNYFKEDYISVLEGGRIINQALLDEKFDYIFFTGSVAVGKTVMSAAAKHLTPITLELGGKSPCIVDVTAKVDLAAKRIIWGKLINSGQTCIAPDYILVHKNVKSELIDSMKKYIHRLYGENVLENMDYPKIINEKHFERLLGLINPDKVIFGGRNDKETLQIEPAIIDNTSWDEPIMQEEIFGPLLPILEFEHIDEVVKAVNNRPKPLALYLFANDKKVEETVLTNISFGGGCINDTIMHIATSHMPFGGVGESGMGAYHGRNSFDTFTHKKSILKKSNLIDIAIRYPPFKNKLNLVKWLMS